MRIPLGSKGFELIQLNVHTLTALSEPGLRVNSFTLTEKTVSLSISKEVQPIKAEDVVGTLGIDRNLRNLAVGNEEQVTLYNMAKVVEIGENTRSIVGSFKRNDARIRKRLSSKYGARRKNRVEQILHRVTKKIVSDAKANRQAIIFEDIKGIRRLYGKGNGQGRAYRGRMNSWPYTEPKRQTEYKAAWEGVPVITLTKSETRGTTMDCPKCGERLQWAARGDAEHYRRLWCEGCRRWMDRDVVAVMNISRRGRLRFDRSKGEAREAVKGNPTKTVILRVDASKLLGGKRDVQPSLQNHQFCPRDVRRVPAPELTEEQGHRYVGEDDERRRE